MADGVTLAEAEALGLALGDELGATDAEALAEGETEGLGLTDGLGLTLGLADGLAEGEALGVTEALGLADGEAEALGLTNGDGLGVEPGAGSKADRLFCGPGVVRIIKSFGLLSVSSPLPINSSSPPASILVGVEEELAFLSRLWPALGLAVVVASESVAAPIPNLSTKVESLWRR